METTEGATINDALLQVGNIGRYQLFMLFWASICCGLTGMQSLIIIFTQADMDFRCTNTTVAEGVNTHPNISPNHTIYGACTHPNSTDECSRFDYSSEAFTSSVISEFDLVCSRSILMTVTNMLSMLIKIPGGFITSQSIDRLGRKKTTVIGLLLLGTVCIATAYSTNIYMYMVFRSLGALPAVVIYDSCAAFLSEVTTPHRRPHIVIAMTFGWGAGILALSPFAYWLRDWRALQMATSIPNFVLFIVAIWVFDESPHWLYSQGKYKEAQEVLNKIAKWNNCTHLFTVSLTSPDEKLTSADRSEQETDADSPEPKTKSQLLQILRTKSFIKILFICGFGWFACNMGYGGLILGLEGLVGDVYLNNLFGGLAEMFAYCITFLIVPHGRKLVYIVLLAMGGLSLIASALVQDMLPDMIWPVIATTMLGRLSISAGWQIMYLWCIELFPTTVRVTMLEISMWVGHIGSAIAPFTTDLPKLITNPAIRSSIIAPVLYGVLLLTSSCLATLLPETNNKTLPVNLAEASANLDSDFEVGTERPAMLSAAGQMFSWVKRKVEKTTAHYLGHDFDPSDADPDSDITIKEINHMAKNLMFNGNLSAEEKEELVSKIGHMAYMGAPEAGRTAANCLHELITLLKNRRTSPSLKEKIVMAISEICYLNRDNQNRTINALPCLTELMGNINDVHMSRLACYCITCIVCNNYATLLQLREIPMLRENLRRCKSVEKMWTGWSDNYAVLLEDILALNADTHLSP